jgi:hypothetical protein
VECNGGEAFMGVRWPGDHRSTRLKRCWWCKIASAAQSVELGKDFSFERRVFGLGLAQQLHPGGGFSGPGGERRRQGGLHFRVRARPGRRRVPWHRPQSGFERPTQLASALIHRQPDGDPCMRIGGRSAVPWSRRRL